jgi:hypothetical protein
MANSLTYTRLLIAVFMLAMRGFVWGGTITDVLNAEIVGSRSSYGSWTEKKHLSNAIYAGHSTGSLSIQIKQSDKKSGIVTTTSGGKAKKITVKFHSNTTKRNKLNIYGKNTAYSSAEDLYSTTKSKQGTLIGTLTCGENTNIYISSSYEYIGICVAGNYTVYISDLSIEWENDSYQSETGKIATTTTFPKNKYSAFLGETFVAPTVTVSIGEAAVTYSSSDESVATVNATTGEVSLKASGTTTITANYTGSETYAASSASYTLTVQNTGKYVWNATTIYTEKTTLATVTDENDLVSITFAKNDASSSPAYYVEGNAVRTYYKNTIDFSVPEGYVITGIAIDYISGYGYSFIPNKGSFSVKDLLGKWAAFSSCVTLESTGGTRFTSLTVSYTKLPEIGSVNVSSAGVATYCPTTPVIIGNGTISSIVTGVNSEGRIELNDIEVIPAGTGVMLFGQGNHKLYSCEDYTATVPVTNYLVGVTTDTPAIIDSHVLQNGVDGIAFYQVKTAGITTVTAGKAYLLLPNGTLHAKTINIFDETESTDIYILKRDYEIESIHTIDGKKVDYFINGINIIRLKNGKIIKSFNP